MAVKGLVYWACPLVPTPATVFVFFLPISLDILMSILLLLSSWRKWSKICETRFLDTTEFRTGNVNGKGKCLFVFGLCFCAVCYVLCACACALLCSAVLWCAVQYSAVLCCAVLCYTECAVLCLDITFPFRNERLFISFFLFSSLLCSSKSTRSR